MEKLTSIKQKIVPVDLRRGGAVTHRIVGRELTRIRERIMLRDGAACRKCGKMVGKLEVDHIVPLFRGGHESMENRQLLCIDCHKIKSFKEGIERGGSSNG